ncbi:MAG: glucose-1-phosphate adenylyltransferase subunit GlgD [Clostridia bacterium]|nr:glucose-1-phosphate adenylyltransferase subunit GlgD [Clostridia bacterium]
MKAIGVVFSNIHDTLVPELTRSRTMASVPFGGRYRMIDFVLSNLVNSGIEKVGVITKYNYQSLMDHIGSGKDWDLSRKNAGVILLPPYGGVESTNLYKTRLEALKSIMGFLTRSTEEYVVMTDCDKVMTMDFTDIIRYHEKNRAEITCVYRAMEGVSRQTAMQNVFFEVAEGGRISNVIFRPDQCSSNLMSLNIFVLKRQLLIDIVVRAVANGFTSLHRDILLPGCSNMRIFGYEFSGYCAMIDSLASYYKTSMELLDKNVMSSLFGERLVYTKVRDSAPTKYVKGCRAVESVIADGCEIYGVVENSILFRGVKVAKGAVVRNSILMQDTVVSENAILNSVITDKNVYIRDRRILSGCPELPYFITKNTIL